MAYVSIYAPFDMSQWDLTPPTAGNQFPTSRFFDLDDNAGYEVWFSGSDFDKGDPFGPPSTGTIDQIEIR